MDGGWRWVGKKTAAHVIFCVLHACKNMYANTHTLYSMCCTHVKNKCCSLLFACMQKKACQTCTNICYIMFLHACKNNRVMFCVLQASEKHNITCVAALRLRAASVICCLRYPYGWGSEVGQARRKAHCGNLNSHGGNLDDHQLHRIPKDYRRFHRMTYKRI